MGGDKANAKKAYDAFLQTWKDADSDLPMLIAAKKEYAILPTSISVEPLALGLKKGEKNLKAVVDGVLHDLEKSGDADKLFAKWYGPTTKLQFEKRSFKIDTDKI